MGKLPKEIKKKLSRKKIVILIIIPILAVLVVNTFFIVYFESYSRNAFYFSVNKKLKILKNLDKKTSWLVIGDSSGNQGVKPSMLQDSLGGSSVNLCTYADMTLLDDCWMIDYLIKHDKKPDNVLIVRVYDTWHRDINYTLYGQYPFSWIYGNAVEPDIKIPLNKKKDVFISHFFPIYHQADRVKQLIQKPSRFFKEPMHINKYGYFAHIWGPNEYETTEDAKFHKWFTANNSVKISEQNQLAMDYLINIAGKEKINIFLANSPLYKDLYYDTAFNNYYSALSDSLDAFCAHSEYLHYLNNPPLLFDKKYMQNSDHVTDEGASLFTEHLINIISETN